MTRLNTFIATAAAVLIFISSSAFAEMANGSYNHDFSGEVPVWDISGSYSATDTDTDTGIVTILDFTLNEDPSGALTGTGTFSLDGEALSLHLHNDSPVTITGKVTSSGTATRVLIKALISGTGTVDADNVTFTATRTANYDIDGISHQLVLTNGSTSAKLKEITTGRHASGSLKLVSGSTLDLPAGSDGDWNLTLNLVPYDSKKYDGTASTATVETSTGGEVDLTPTGSYASKTDTSKITLKGPKGTGASLNLLISTVGSNMIVDSAKGKLYGQSVKFTAP